MVGGVRASWGGDGAKATALPLREFNPPRPDVEERVLPDDGPHPETELLRGLDPVGGGRRRGVLGVDELGGGRDPLLELRMAAEEEGLEAPPVLRLRQEELEHLGRLVRIVARADKLLHAALVRLALEVAAVAVDRGDRRELEPDPQNRVRRLAQDRGADVIARLRA